MSKIPGSHPADVPLPLVKPVRPPGRVATGSTFQLEGREFLSEARTPFDHAPRCGARNRKGASCRNPAMPNGRCRMHGGATPGQPNVKKVEQAMRSKLARRAISNGAPETVSQALLALRGLLVQRLEALAQQGDELDTVAQLHKITIALEGVARMTAKYPSLDPSKADDSETLRLMLIDRLSRIRETNEAKALQIGKTQPAEQPHEPRPTE